MTTSESAAVHFTDGKCSTACAVLQVSRFRTARKPFCSCVIPKLQLRPDYGPLVVPRIRCAPRHEKLRWSRNILEGKRLRDERVVAASY